MLASAGRHLQREARWRQAAQQFAQDGAFVAIGGGARGQGGGIEAHGKVWERLMGAIITRCGLRTMTRWRSTPGTPRLARPDISVRFTMPYLQLDVNGRCPVADKKRLAAAMSETYAQMMSVDIRRISVAIR